MVILNINWVGVLFMNTTFRVHIFLNLLVFWRQIHQYITREILYNFKKLHTQWRYTKDYLLDVIFFMVGFFN